MSNKQINTSILIEFNSAIDKLLCINIKLFIKYKYLFPNTVLF